MIQQQDSLNTAIFIRKLFKILNTSDYNSIITWDKDGRSIKIHSFSALENQILEIEFRHKNYKSFVRQLNMYGFKKLKKSTPEMIFFFHPLFSKNSEQNLYLIQRTQSQKASFREIRTLSNSYQEYLSQKRKILLQVEQKQKSDFKKNGSYGINDIKMNHQILNRLSNDDKSQNDKLTESNRRTSINTLQSEDRRKNLNLEIFSKPHSYLPTYPSLKRSDQFIDVKQNLLEKQDNNLILTQSSVFPVIPQQTNEIPNGNFIVYPNCPLAPQSSSAPYNQIVPFYHFQPQFLPQIMMIPPTQPQYVYQSPMYPIYQSMCVPQTQYFTVFK